MISEIVSPIRRSTQEPGERPDILRSGTGYLNEPIIPLQEPNMRKQVMNNYKHSYQGVQQNTH